MMILNQQEEELVRVLEERVSILTGRLDAVKPSDLPWMREERTATLWVLQLVAKARAAGCEIFDETCVRGNEAASGEATRQLMQECIERTKERAAAEAIRQKAARKNRYEEEWRVQSEQRQSEQIRGAAEKKERQAQKRERREEQREREAEIAVMQPEAMLPWHDEAAAILDRALPEELRRKAAMLPVAEYV